MVRKSGLAKAEIGARGSAGAPKVVWTGEAPNRCTCPNCHGRGTVEAPLDGIALIGAIAGDIGEQSFTTKLLFQYAERIDGPLRQILAEHSREHVGWTLAKDRGPGKQLERLGSERNRAAVWQLVTMRV